ncbi:MAG: transcription elongation factor GreAB [Verrucomicrobia bacterium RIFCSPLOWO2_12_FULL_64_8]|nr:MAG: transcription elongation factor GreAB [Verrucomicrobia bacterium RIFCSPLOWO2_12_FULL_64_8]
MNSEAVQALVAKTPSLKSAKAKLESMEPGAYCIHRSWGFGQIKEYDEAEQKLVFDFQGRKGHRMDPAFCVGTLEVLSPKHLLARKQTEPEAIAHLVAKDPVQLVVEGLEAYPNKATTAIDLELVLQQVVGEEKFKRWWATTRKHIARDPRIAVPAKKTECYVLREEPVSAEDEFLEQFHNTRSARRRIQLAEELLAAAGRQEMAADLKPVLTGLVDAVKDSNQLHLAERLYGAAVRDELAKTLSVDVATLAPSLSDLVGDARRLSDIADRIPVHFQTHFLELVMDAHPIEWKDLTFTLLKTSQGKFTTECINFLVDHGHAEELAAALKRWQAEQNLRAPVLLWIVKNRASKKFAKLLNELITPRLLSAIFFAIDYEALQSAGARRIPLGEILSDDLDLIPDLLATADPETARDLANTLLLNQGFEELTKKSLIARFIKIFPNIQALVSGDGESRDEQLLVSRESYSRRRQEYDLIVAKKIPENSRAIAAAREHGDLRENAEFKMAKQDQSVLMAHKGQLERDLAHARVIDFASATTDQIGVGTVVDLKDATTGAAVRYTVLGAWDGDPEKHIISYKTPLGLALLAKKVGDHVKVKVAGAAHDYVVTGITRYADGAPSPAPAAVS